MLTAWNAVRPPALTRLSADSMVTNGSFQLDSVPNGRTIDGQSTLVRHRNGATWRIIHDPSF